MTFRVYTEQELIAAMGAARDHPYTEPSVIIEELVRRRPNFGPQTMGPTLIPKEAEEPERGAPFDEPLPAPRQCMPGCRLSSGRVDREICGPCRASKGESK